MTLFGTDPEPAATKPGTDRPKWQAIDGRAKCDRCVADAAAGMAAFGVAYVAVPFRPARWRRTQGRTDVRLCYEHAQPVRADDERDAA